MKPYWRKRNFTKGTRLRMTALVVKAATVQWCYTVLASTSRRAWPASCKVLSQVKSEPSWRSEQSLLELWASNTEQQLSCFLCPSQPLLTDKVPTAPASIISNVSAIAWVLVFVLASPSAHHTRRTATPTISTNAIKSSPPDEVAAEFATAVCHRASRTMPRCARQWTWSSRSNKSPKQFSYLGTSNGCYVYAARCATIYRRTGGTSTMAPQLAAASERPR